MFEGLRRRHIEKLADQAREYLENHYVKSIIERSADSHGAEGPSKPQHSMQENDSGGHVQFQSRDDGIYFSFSEEDDIPSSMREDDYPAYGAGDNYDSSTIQRTMRNLSSSTPASRILKELGENTNMTFVDKMLEHISKRHIRDTDVYKAAQIDRRLFSKIVSNREYKPAKDTCVAFAFALKLTLSEAEDLLSRAGYTLSHSSKRDVVIEYFFKEHIYNLDDINEVLYQLEQKIIGG